MANKWTTSDELKPCPFCGAEGKLKRHIYHELDDTFGVICSACEAQTSQFFIERDDAIEAWNRRSGNYILVRKYTNKEILDGIEKGNNHGE